MREIDYGQLMKKSINVLDFDILIFPANIREWHWYSMVVFLNHITNSGTIVPINSLQGATYGDEHAAILRFLNKVIKTNHCCAINTIACQIIDVSFLM